MFDKRDKVVYFHIAKEDFEVDGKLFKQGQVVYIGSGGIERYNVYTGRMKRHQDIWDKLEFKVIMTDLSMEEARRCEQQFVTEYWEAGLLNSREKIGEVRDYSYEYFNNIFILDDDFKLRWKIPRKLKAGKYLDRLNQRVEGTTTGDYARVNINHVSYLIHRIIWVLYNKKDAHKNAVVDHIDRNRRNNSPSNLRLVSYSDNSINRNHKVGISGEQYIIFNTQGLRFNVCVKIDNRIIRKTFSIRPLIREGFSEAEATSIQLQSAIKYRNSLLN